MSRFLLFLTSMTATLLSSNTKASADEWAVCDKRENVEVYAEFSMEPEHVWEQLASLNQELSETLQIRTSGESIRIFLYSSQKRYEQSLSAAIPQCRQRKAIFVRTGAVSDIYSYQSRSLLMDIRHEYTHALVHQYVDFLPIWLDEGLAEYFEDPLENRGSSSRAANVRWKARIGSIPTLSSLDAIPSANDLDADSYRDSWAWVCFLLNDSQETRECLQSYLQKIHGGEAPKTFSATIAESIPDLRRRSAVYFRKLNVPTSNAHARPRGRLSLLRQDALNPP